MTQSSTYVHLLRYNALQFGAIGNATAKKRFHSRAQTLLRRLAADMALPTAARDIRSCMGGPAVMGEVILHTDDFYLMIHDRGVLFRTCDGRKDYHGDRNNNWSHDCLADIHALGLRIRGHVVAKIAARELLQ